MAKELFLISCLEKLKNLSADTGQMRKSQEMIEQEELSRYNKTIRLYKILHC